MRFSAVLPTYNSKETLLRTIKSVRDKDCEIIVVDDCSTDGTEEMIKSRFPEVKYYRNEKERWPPYCRNKGARKATGKYILFLDSDVYMDDPSLEKLLKSIEEHDIVVPSVVFENGVKMFPRDFHGFKYRDWTAAFLIRRDVFSKLESLGGPFDETYKFYCEDIDFFSRCKALGIDNKYIPEATAIHAIKEPSNEEKKFYFYIRNLIYYHLKLGRYSKYKNSKLIELLLKGFVFSMLNCSFRKDYHNFPSNRKRTVKEIMELVFNSKALTQRSRVFLIKKFFQGIYWNFKNLREIWRKRKEIERKANYKN